MHLCPPPPPRFVLSRLWLSVVLATIFLCCFQGDRAKVAVPAAPATVFAALDLYQEPKLSLDDIAKWALAAGLLD